MRKKQDILFLGFFLVLGMTLPTLNIKDSNKKEIINSEATESDASETDAFELKFSLKPAKNVIYTIDKELEHQDREKTHYETKKKRDEEKAEALAVAEKERVYRQTVAQSSHYSQPAQSGTLTSRMGVNNYNGHKETYYNLNMSRVVSNAQAAGLQGEYGVREDGVKTFGGKVIVAADQSRYAYGSTVQTSLGEGIVLDTGTFIYSNPEQYDIATTW